MENKTRYSIIGTGYLVKIFDKNHPLYIKLKSIPNVDFMDYLNLSHSIHSLDLKDENGKTYSSFNEIKPTEEFNLYRPDVYSRLEIRLNGFKHKKIFFQKLIEVNSLFPLPPTYILRRTVLQNEGLLVLEYDKGKFGTTTHSRKFHSVDQLNFELMTIPETNETCVKSIWMEEFEIKIKKPDTLNFGMQTFLV